MSTIVAWFLKHFDQKQCAIGHLRIIVDLISEFLITSQAG
jgi:hypothetical protein